MQFFQEEFRRLREAKSAVQAHFHSFGVNKKQEITRLLYEISKRDKISPALIIPKDKSTGYSQLKKYLLEIRYPDTFSTVADFRPYLPKVELKRSEFLDTGREFSPQKIFIEKGARSSFLARQLTSIFPQARFSVIHSFKDYECQNRRDGIEEYNKRRKAIFVINQGYDFFKKCPCTKSAVNCGYHIFNLGFGCIFECSYCYLQAYTNTPGIILPANIERFFGYFKQYKNHIRRIGTGEFSDSLALDEITGYSLAIIDFFRKHRNITFEFKTKSVKIKNLLHSKHAGNIVVSWSLNPQTIIDENEFFTASLKERLDAAVKCIKAGYQVGFHFDPIIYFPGWHKDYSLLIEDLFSKIKPKDIAWISLGTFRFPRQLKPIIERRFPANKILDGELILGYDDKLRYSDKHRYVIYKEMIGILSKHSRRLKLYLCMEESSMWQNLRLKMPWLV